MDTKPLLALATAAALPQLEYESWNVTRDWTKVFRLADGADDSTGILIDLSPHGIVSPEIEAMQAARARYVAAACNAVPGLVQERGLLLEACRGAEDALINILGDWAPVTRENLPEEFVGARDAIDALRAAIEQAEGDN